MNQKNRSFLLFSLVPAVLLGGVITVAQAADAKATKWSSPATWPNKKVPAAGDKVEIARGKNVILDVSPPALGGLTINGKLSFSRNGKEFHITGNQSTVRAGTGIRVKTERPEVPISLSEMNKDSWVLFELPGFTKASAGTAQDSPDALRKARETSYFKDKNALWVKLVVPEDPEPPIRPTVRQTSISVSR